MRGGGGGAPAAFTPASIAGIMLWHRADLGVTNGSDVQPTNGQTCKTWADRSGSGDTNRNSTNGTDGVRPTFVATNASYNNKPTLHFDNLKFMESAGAWSVNIPAVCTVFIVGNNSAFGNAWFGARTASPSFQLTSPSSAGANTSTEMFMATTVYDQLGLASLANPHIYVCEFNGAASHIYQDSVTAAGTGDPGGSTPDGITLCGLTGGTNSLIGDLAEFAIYSGVLSLASRTALVQYAGLRYSITVT
jgi:hypothetical protein